jgi:phosphotransferase system HPr (HPr) family protein
MLQEQLKVVNAVGLHARPAALFVGQAGRYQSSIQVRNVTAPGEWVDAKSILGILTLGVEKDHEIEIRAEGPDEAEAIKALADLVRSDFAGTPRRGPAGG